MSKPQKNPRNLLALSSISLAGFAGAFYLNPNWICDKFFDFNFCLEPNNAQNLLLWVSLIVAPFLALQQWNARQADEKTLNSIVRVQKFWWAFSVPCTLYYLPRNTFTAVAACFQGTMALLFQIFG
jgi:hypothetical protein